jgi:hypothetical protein
MSKTVFIVSPAAERANYGGVGYGVRFLFGFGFSLSGPHFFDLLARQHFFFLLSGPHFPFSVV